MLVQYIKASDEAGAHFLVTSGYTSPGFVPYDFELSMEQNLIEAAKTQLPPGEYFGRYIDCSETKAFFYPVADEPYVTRAARIAPFRKE